MNTMKCDMVQVTRLRHAPARQASDEVANAAHSCHVSRVTHHASRFTFHAPAFTLIELLTVISIIGVLAALLFPVLKGVKRQQFIRNAQAEMAQLETAIERYKAAYGFYPPDNQLNPANPLIPNPLMNQLYFELLGTTNVATPPGSPSYQSLDDPSLLPLSQALSLIHI